MLKQSKKIISLLLVIIMLAAAAAPTTTVQAAKSPVTKSTTQDTRTGKKYGNTFYLPFWGNYYYRTTVNLRASSKKTKFKLKYSHKIRNMKSGTFKLTVGKKTVTICKPDSFPYTNYGVPPELLEDDRINLYLESVEIKTGKKWKKVKITNAGVVKDNLYSEMKPFTLKKIPKGTQMRITFNARVGTPRR